jgi:hypothetical protein
MQARILALVLLITTAGAFAAKKPKRTIEWKQGVVLESRHRREVTPGVGRTSDAKIDINNFAIQGQDLVYTVEETKKTGGVTGGLLTQAIGNGRPRRCKLIVNDNVLYAEDGDFLVVLDADLKVCKLEIVGRERAKKEPPKDLPPSK